MSVSYSDNQKTVDYEDERKKLSAFDVVTKQIP